MHAAMRADAAGHVMVNGRQLAVEVVGHGPAVLLAHGLGGAGNFYQPLVDALRDRHTVVRVDGAGAGRSETAEGISIVSHAGDLSAVLDALGIARAAVVGHSMGTLVARELAAQEPGRVSSLVLLGAVRAPDDEAAAGQRARAAVVREGGTAAVAPTIIANTLSRRTRQDRPAAAALARELVMRQDPEGYARNCEALAAAVDPGPISSSIPVLLITGDEDTVGPPGVSHELAAAHPAAEVVLLPEVGHWTALEAITAVNEHVAAFLRPSAPEPIQTTRTTKPNRKS